MPSVSAGLRAVAVLAVLTNFIATGSRVTIVALLLGAIYVGFWLSVPRPWSIWLAVVTAPLALIAVTGADEAGQVTSLLWVCPALALGFAIPERRGIAVLVLLVVVAVLTSVLISSRSSIDAVWQLALPMTVAGLAASAVRRLRASAQWRIPMHRGPGPR